MSKRLQVLIPSSEYKGFQKIAKEAGLSLGEWVRQAMRNMADIRTNRKAGKTLKEISRLSRYKLPTGDIDQMLAEIDNDKYPSL